LSDCTEMRDPTGQFILGPEYAPPNKNRFVVEVPDKFATARWSRDADVATIARCILGTLKYEPHTADTAALRQALETVIKNEVGSLRRVPLNRGPAPALGPPSGSLE
jgi:hypothetical protein